MYRSNPMPAVLAVFRDVLDARFAVRRGDATVEIEAWRRAVAVGGLARADRAMEQAGGGWIEGELLAFAEAAVAWPPLDRWEGTSTSGDASIYSRVVVPVHTGDVARPLVAAWVYASTRAPAGSVALASPAAN